MGPGMTASMSEQGVLSPDGSCKTFSANANGYARGEAISAIFIKPLADALRDGNPIRSIIRATSSISDGRGTGNGISVPNDIAQEAMIRRTYELAGISDYSETAFVECHGTGTPVGDPIEARAVGRVFGPSGGVIITSVKPNLGHSEGASGLTSLIKSVLALENRVIPPNIKLNEPNPKIPWDTYGLSVPTEPLSWPKDRKERVSVNSFGIGGTNAHVILDSPHSFGICPVPEPFNLSPKLLVYSANNVESLNSMISNYKNYIQKNPRRVGDLAFTLSNKRVHLPHRAFAVKNPLGMLTTSTPYKSGEPPAVVMVFTGQGAQWPQMGGGLFHSSSFPAFKKTIRSLDAHLRTLEHAPEWTIEEELLMAPDISRLGLAELSQPVCTAVQIALIDTFASIGVEPTAVVGHSSGEVAAAYACGALTATEAITVAFYRGQVTKLLTKSGAMAAIGMGSDEVQQYLQTGVIIACENSPKSVTLAGDAHEVEIVVARIKEANPEVLARRLQVDKAYHSHHMAEIGDQYHDLLQKQISAKKPTKLFFSSVENGLLTQSSDFGPKYWQKNLESPVLFKSAILSIIQHENAKNMMFLEVGPHSALAGPLRQIQAHHSDSSPYASALTRNQHDIESFLTAIGHLYSFNATVDLGKVSSQGSTLSDLPRYPWDHSKRFWYESRLSKEWRNRQHKYHDLLGVRVTESLDFDILYRNLFHLDNAPWIRDHKVGEDIVFPFAGYAAMIGEAVRQATGVDQAFKLRNVIVSTALVLTEGPPVEIMTTLRRHRLTDYLDSDWWEFTIASYTGSIWTKHCSGEARSYAEDCGDAQKSTPLVRKVDTRRCYQYMARSGLIFGPEFQRLSDIRADTVTQDATSELIAKETDGDDYHLHPTVIDASLQLLSVAASKGYATPATKIMVPTNIEEMCIYRCHKDVQVQASASYTPNGSIIGSGQCVSADGKVVLRSSGIRLSVIDEQDPSNSENSTARAEWGPHIDFLDANTLIKPVSEGGDSMGSDVVRSNEIRALTELSHLCMIHTKRATVDMETSIKHMHKFRSWIHRHLQTADLQVLERLDDAVIERRIKRIVHELSQTAAADFAIAIQKINSHIESIFVGKVEALDLLVADNTLTGMYPYMERCDESKLYKHLTHSKPNLRVLEIGAGTGGSTAKVLKLLTLDDRALYSRYTFTDISSGFFVAAKERFGLYPNIEYTTLDISKDPLEQGFNDRKYDLILATNVIHATKSLNQSLTNIRQLLEPNGRLLLTELTSTSKWVNYIWGPLAGWWYGDADGRSEEPYISIERWETELKAAGFCAPDAAVRDSAEPYEMCSVIVARPSLEIVPQKAVTILTLSESEDAKCLLLCLEARGYSVNCSTIENMPLPSGQDVIALLDEKGPYFEDINDSRFNIFKTLVASLNDCGILWITRLSQMQCQDPRFGQIQGIARTIRSELLVDFATCEVDDLSSSSDKIVDVFQRFQIRQENDTFTTESEYAIVENTVHVGRIHSFPMQEELVVSDTTDSITLRSSKPGRLNALYWTHREMAALIDDNVEIETYATGLNFKVDDTSTYEFLQCNNKNLQDVLCAMGIVEAVDDGFGLEAAGVIRRIGPNVQNLKIGDRVMLIGRGGFGTRVVVSENHCEIIPDGLSFEDAATMPCVFATSIYSIFTVGNLKRGQVCHHSIPLFVLAFNSLFSLFSFIVLVGELVLPLFSSLGWPVPRYM
jgi:acyl transferase domain-containing protein/protein-L-isoaspartate O-methyltransferase